MIERMNGAMVTEANLLQHAVHGILSKKSRSLFQQMIKSLNVETRPFDDEATPQRLLPPGYEED